jgi:hypothetical protein
MGVSIAIEHALHGWPVFWGAPTYDQVRIAWQDAEYACGGNIKFLKSEMTAYFPNEGKVIFCSLDDPDNARGHSFRMGIFDEVADIKPRAYYEVVSPILANYTDSIFWGIGTPKGRNWFFQEWQKAHNNDSSMSWQIPTLGCEVVNGELVRKTNKFENPEFPWDELVKEYEALPQRVFEQEYLAQFLEGQGVVFRNIKACMNAPNNAKPEDHKGHTIVAGVDWAKQNDYTAISIGCLDCKQELAIDRFNKIDFHFQRGRLKTLCEKWKLGNGLVETNSIGEPNLEELQRDGLPFRGFLTTGTSKPPLIENLALVLEKEEWQFIDDPVWTSELEAYERTVSKATGRSSYSAPTGLHDDTVIARALMVQNDNHGVILFGA